MTQTEMQAIHRSQPALLLFDGAVAIGRLSIGQRPLLRVALESLAMARAAGVENPGRVARDTVLAAPIPGLTFDEQNIVASALIFQRDKLRSAREPSFLRLDKRDQKTALRLAAILYLADVLEGTALRIESSADQVTLFIGGDGTPAALTPIEERAERWRDSLGAIRIVASEHHQQAPHTDPAHATGSGDQPSAFLTEGLRGDEPIAEGARRMLRRLFERMLAREDDVQHGEDHEDVHQMRVATRRLRASLQIVEPIYDPAAIRRFRGRLRGVARSLGAVRDRDVFLLHILAYGAHLPESQRAALAPLVQAVEEQRSAVRAELLDQLGSGRYKRFTHAFATFLTTPGAHVAIESATGSAPRVRDMAGSMIWRRYEEWRAFEVLFPDASDDALHQARIAGKRLRYTIEFFADALGPAADDLLAPLMALQENLGALQDSVVAREHVHALGLADNQGARAYLDARAEERGPHLRDLPGLWQAVSGEDYRRKLADLIISM